MKHAYLIIAHNEFDVLQQLIAALDHERNDIYLHIDKKVKSIPSMSVRYAKLFVVDQRVDVRWGDVSQIESEYVLFEQAFDNPENYTRYILISGTHLPLRPQSEINAFFEAHKEKEILSYLYTNSYEANFKIGRYHLFTKHFRDKNRLTQRGFQLFWHVALKIQQLLDIKRDTTKINIKANNWVCLTAKAVEYIIEKKAETLTRFQHTLCGDEFFIPYLLENSNGRFHLMNYDKLLYNDFQGSNPRVLTMNDYDFLIHSDFLFARKFSKKDMEVVSSILNLRKNKDE